TSSRATLKYVADRRDQDTQTGTRRRTRQDGQANASFRLVCIEGPDRGTHFAIPADSAGRILVGQSSACTIRLRGPLVSRRHLVLDVQGPNLHVTDLGSYNGSFINDVAIVEAFLWGNETLRLGDTIFRVELDEVIGTPKLADAARFGRLVGESVEMRRLY